MIRKLGLEDLLASEPSRRRDLVLAMVAEFEEVLEEWDYA